MGSLRRRLAREESGLTLVELMVAASIGLLVVFGAMKMLRASADSAPDDTKRAAAVQKARTEMYELTRELRGGYGVVTAAPNKLSFLTYLKRTTCGGASKVSGVIQCRVTYTCQTGACYRIETAPTVVPATLGRRILDGISSTSVFTYSPSPAASDYVNVKLVFPATASEDAITLEDGATLRNSGGST